MFGTVSQMLKARVEREHLKFILTRIKVWKITQKKGFIHRVQEGPQLDVTETFHKHQNPSKAIDKNSPIMWNAKLKRGTLSVLRNKNNNKPKICFMEMIVPPYLESGHYNHRFIKR